MNLFTKLCVSQRFFLNFTVRKLGISPSEWRHLYHVVIILLLGLSLSHHAQACSLQFTSPARGSTVASPQVGVSGTGSGNANSGDQGQVTAYINGMPFFSQSGTFTTLINFLGSGAASVNLQKGANTLSVSGSVNGCSASDSMVVYYQPAPAQAQKNAGEPEICNGTNPVNDATGNKFQMEADYQGVGDFPLQLVRYYNSAYSDVRSLGKSWRHTYERELYFDAAKLNAYVVRPDGKAYRFVKSGGLWISDGDINDRFTALTNTTGTITGWQLFKGDDNSFEYYDAMGRLTMLINRHGMSQDIGYDEVGRISRVTDRTTQRAMDFAYDSHNRLTTVTDPGGSVYSYVYDISGRLAQVTWPGVIAGHPSRQYLYNEQTNTSNANLPNALTGILDENGNRYATYRYDAQGRGVSTEHVNGIDLHQLSYNADGSTTITDAFGHDRTYRYQTVLGVKHSVGQNHPAGSGCAASASNISYDANGNIASRTDFNGNLGCYTYDLSRNLETTRVEGLASGQSCPTNLAAYNPPASSSQRKISTLWHSNYRLPTQIDQAGQRLSFSYDATGNLLQKTITDTATQQSRSWTYTYNSNGQILTADGPRSDINDITTYTYYNDTAANHHPGDLYTVSNALSHTTTFTDYDANGRLLSLTAPNGLVVGFAYDPLGRLTHKTIDGNATVYDYDPVGNLIKVTRPTGVHYTFTYDAAHRLTDITDALGGKIHYTLDSMGNRIKEDILDAGGAVVKTHRRVYDALNRLAQDIGAYNQTTSYAYDANGNLTHITDAASHATQQQYDTLDRLIRSTDALNGQTDYDYDTLDRLVQVTDANNRSTQYSYNSLGDLLQLDSPNTGVTQYAYDSVGNLSQKTDAGGSVAAYQYDALNRIVLVDYPDDTLDVHYIYDSHDAGQNGIGRLVSVSDGTGETQYTYDLRGNLLTRKTVLDAKNYLTRYTYNAEDSITQTYYPSGRQIDFHYDPNGRVASLTTQHGEATQTLADNIHYLPFGSSNSLSLGNGLAEAQHYDLDYRPIERGLGSLAGQGYSYDPTGNIAAITDLNNAANNKTFSYDALSRLTTAQDANRQLAYGLDATGNRQALATNAQVDDYAYALGSDRLLSTTSKSFGYDESGHVIADSRYQYRYGDHNRLTNVLGSGTTLAEYAYNALGQRVKKTTSAASTHYHYNQDGQLIAETDTNGDTQKEYLYLNDRLIVLTTPAADQDHDGVIDSQDNCRLVANLDQRDTDSDGFGNGCDADFNNNGIVDPSDLSLLKPRLGTTTDPNLDINGNGIIDPFDLSQVKSQIGKQPGPGADPNAAANARIYFSHTDHLGTPTLLTDGDQNIVWQANYDPFGKATVSTETVTNNIRFPGQYYDAETGWHYNMHRYYDPGTGRYLQSDPIGLSGGINTYTYVRNNPLNYTDSTGLVVDTVVDVVSLGLSVQAYKDDPSLTNGLGLAYDALATAIPGLPAGFGIIKNVGSKACKVASPNQLNKQIQRGLAPKGVQRVDIGKVTGEQTHVHFDDGSALNIDGTWKHGESDLSNSVKDWLQSNGWTTPK